MKKILLFLSGLAAIPLFTSCTDYGVYGVASTGPVVGNPGFVSGGLAPLQVGFVATTYDRWAWDPYCRHYYDRSCGRYWDYSARRYCTVIPRRYSTAVYPVGYRRGASLACPTYLPRTPVVVHRGGSRGVPRSGVYTTSNRGRYAPVVHAPSRSSSYLRGQSRSNSISRGNSGRILSTPNLYPGRSTPTPSRGTVRPPSTSRGSNLRTVSTGPTVTRSPYPSGITNIRQVSPSTYRRSTTSPSRSSSSTRSSGSSRVTPTRSSSSSSRGSSSYTRPQPTRSTPTVRSSGYSRSTPSRSPSYSRPQPSRSTPTVRSSGSSRSAPSPSRSTSGSSRSMNTARQRTR